MCGQYCPATIQSRRVWQRWSDQEVQGKLEADEDLLSTLWTLCARLICQCRPDQSCHADVVIEEFQR